MLKFLLTLLVFASNYLVKAENELLDKFLIVGGYGAIYTPERVHETETLDSTTFEAEQITANLDVRNTVGFSTNLGPTVCGGTFGMKLTKKCFTLTNGTTWSNSFNLTTPREQASYIPISAGQTLVIGGYGKEFMKNLDTMEMVSTASMGSTVVEKTLPFTFRSGCATKINQTHGLIIGGTQDKSKSSKSHFIKFDTMETSPGPEMLQTRYEFGCATDADNSFVIVGGGKYSRNLASTEILDLTKPIPSWTSGPDLPTAAVGLSMVDSANGILAIGGGIYNGDWSSLKSILRLECNNGKECQWVKAGELTRARRFFSVIPPYTDVATTSTTPTTTATTIIDSDTLLQSHFNLLTLLGYECFKNSEASFSCEKI